MTSNLSTMIEAERPVTTKFVNGKILRAGSLVEGDVWISSATGLILDSQSTFYESHTKPDRVVDLQGKILSPGFIDVQLNGGHGVDFSIPRPDFAERLSDVNRRFAAAGVTSYLPTVISQKASVYQQVIPHLGPSGHDRDPGKGAESLGAHVEGPFLAPCRNGIHNKSVLTTASSWSDIEDVYGADSLENGHIRKVTAAPELGNMTSLIPNLTSRGIIFSIGHSDADLSQASDAISAGATMVTHLFNAMRPFGHRDPGIFGLLGFPTSRPGTPSTSRPGSRHASHPTSPATFPQQPSRFSSTSSTNSPRMSLDSPACASPTSYRSKPTLPTRDTPQPWFGLIADGIHLSPASLKIAYAAFPQGAILVTDALSFAGLPDGVYSWTNGDEVVKTGAEIRGKENGRLAGVAVSLIDCVNNFRRFTGAGVAEVLETVTSHPARMLGSDVEGRKGGLEAGMDADLCVLEEVEEGGEGSGDLRVVGVWKFGVQVA
jgi:N-acetylglucosamine-6-phosphate deacetylase